MAGRSIWTNDYEIERMWMTAFDEAKELLSQFKGGYAIMIGGTNGGHLTSFSLVDLLPHGRDGGRLHRPGPSGRPRRGPYVGQECFVAIRPGASDR